MNAGTTGPTSGIGCDACSRRAWIRHAATLAAAPAAVALAVLGGCHGETPTGSEAPRAAPGTLPPGVTVAGTVVTLELSRLPELQAPGGSLYLPSLQLVVARIDASTARAWSSVCPHSGCGVSDREGLLLRCPCHGSLFDLTGARVEGPAPTGLTARPATLNAASGRVIVTNA